MGRKLTHEEFMERFYKKNKNAENIEILEQYKGNAIKIKCRCKIDGYEWETTPNILLQGSGCPKCGGKVIRTYKEFVQEIKEINSNIEIVGEYKDTQTKIKCKCKKDGYEWEVRPADLLRGSGCPKCYGNIKLTHEEFINRIKKINNDIEIIGEYINNSTKIKCRCKVDNHIWETVPSDLLRDIGCPKCNSSKGEKRIAKYLDDKNIEYEEQYRFKDCKFKKQLPFDFYISSLNTIIEYDGEQHYKIVKHFGGLDEFIDTKIRDTVKTIYCKENNIKLIRISYWDFDRIEEILDRKVEE